MICMYLFADAAHQILGDLTGLWVNQQKRLQGTVCDLVVAFAKHWINLPRHSKADLAKRDFESIEQSVERYPNKAVFPVLGG